MQTVTVDYASWQRDAERIIVAEKRVAELEEVLDDIFVHGVVGPTPDWMMVPRVEWDQAVQRAKLKPR